jgi:site-specific recombinase XerD
MFNEPTLNTKVLFQFWLSTKKDSSTRMSFEHDVHCFFEFYLRRRSPITVSTISDIHLYKIQFEDILEYVKYLETSNNPRMGKPIARSTIIKRLKSLSSFLEYACERNYLHSNLVESFFALGLEKIELSNFGREEDD